MLYWDSPLGCAEIAKELWTRYRSNVRAVKISNNGSEMYPLWNPNSRVKKTSDSEIHSDHQLMVYCIGPWVGYEYRIPVAHGTRPFRVLSGMQNSASIVLPTSSFPTMRSQQTRPGNAPPRYDFTAEVWGLNADARATSCSSSAPYLRFVSC